MLTKKFCFTGTHPYDLGMGLMSPMVTMGTVWTLLPQHSTSTRLPDAKPDGGSSGHVQVGRTSLATYIVNDSELQPNGERSNRVIRE